MRLLTVFTFVCWALLATVYPPKVRADDGDAADAGNGNPTPTSNFHFQLATLATSPGDLLSLFVALSSSLCTVKEAGHYGT